MLDPQGSLREPVSEAIAPPLIAARPGGVVGNHFTPQIVPLAAFGPGDSRPEHRHDRSGQLGALGLGELVPG